MRDMFDFKFMNELHEKLRLKLRLKFINDDEHGVLFAFDEKSVPINAIAGFDSIVGVVSKADLLKLRDRITELYGKQNDDERVDAK